MSTQDSRIRVIGKLLGALVSITLVIGLATPD